MSNAVRRRIREPEDQVPDSSWLPLLRLAKKREPSQQCAVVRCHNCHRPADTLERSLLRQGEMHSDVRELPTCRTCRCERYSRRGIPRDMRRSAIRVKAAKEDISRTGALIR